MRLSEVEVELLTLDSGFESDTMDFHVALESIRNTRNHVRYQRTGKTVKGFLLTIFTLAKH